MKKNPIDNELEKIKAQVIQHLANCYHAVNQANLRSNKRLPANELRLESFSSVKQLGRHPYADELFELHNARLLCDFAASFTTRIKAALSRMGVEEKDDAPPEAPDVFSIFRRKKAK